METFFHISDPLAMCYSLTLTSKVSERSPPALFVSPQRAGHVPGSHMISKTASPQDRWFYLSCSHPPQQDWYRADPVPAPCIPQMHRRTSDRSLYMFSGSSLSPPFVTLSGSSPVLLCLYLCCIISLPYPLHKLCFMPHLLFSASRCQPFSPVFL